MFGILGACSDIPVHAKRGITVSTVCGLGWFGGKLETDGFRAERALSRLKP